jgi:histone H3/H4
MIVDDFEEFKYKGEENNQNNQNVKVENSQKIKEEKNNQGEIDENKISSAIDQILQDNLITGYKSEEAGENENEEDLENEMEMEENINEDNIAYDANEDVNKDPNASAKKESHKKERSGFTRLPISKIKYLMKLDGDVKLCQKNAYVVLAKMTELFLQELAKNSHSVAKLNRRKTMNLEDIACAVKSIEKYSFIDVNTIFNVETVAELKAREEKFEKKIRQAEIKMEKKDKKESKIEKVITKNNKKNSMQGNMKIDSMFSKDN